MRTTLIILPFIFMLFRAGDGISQTQVFTTLDTNSILVGDHTELNIEFVGPAHYEVLWPEFSDTITSSIEIIKKTEKILQASADNQSVRIQQAYTITCFDSGYYPLPPVQVKFRIPGDTNIYFAESDALLLEVSSIPVDLEADIKDIKEPISAPFTFREAVPYILVFLGTLAAGFIIVYFIRKRKKAEPVFKIQTTPKIPPHQLAIDALETLRYKKLWQNGEIKQYHTELTDIIREYLSAKFRIHAHEYTSDEILEALEATTVNPHAKEKLKQTLFLADMVKFAKMKPLPVEHDASLNHAIDFVRETIHLNGNKEQVKEADQAVVENSSQKEITEETTDQPIKEGKEVDDV